MGDPVLHLLAGPNGAGKSTLHAHVIDPITQLEFVNADVLARQHWPDHPEARSYDAAALAAERRNELIAARASFVTETVFSHDSKVDLVSTALAAGYLVTLHVVVVPVDLAVARVANRVRHGGHTVSELKVRQRYKRLWPLIGQAIEEVTEAIVYDNSRSTTPFRVIARFERGRLVGRPAWPSWTPTPLREATG